MSLPDSRHGLLEAFAIFHRPGVGTLVEHRIEWFAETPNADMALEQARERGAPGPGKREDDETRVGRRDGLGRDAGRPRPALRRAVGVAAIAAPQQVFPGGIRLLEHAVDDDVEARVARAVDQAMTVGDVDQEGAAGGEGDDAAPLDLEQAALRLVEGDVDRAQARNLGVLVGCDVAAGFQHHEPDPVEALSRE
jgi:hypothetical protein